MSISVPSFLTNENMKLLWDVLMENDIFQNKPKEFFIKINTLFNENISSFYEKEKTNFSSLLELNKKFITLFIRYIGLLLKSNKITTTIDNNSSLNSSTFITHQEIQANRINEFEKNLNQIKQDFTNSMALPIPPTPEFKDKMDEPLSELELEIKKTMAQRNYDIEVIHNNIQSLSTEYGTNSSNWLKGEETSIKKEKLSFIEKKSITKPIPSEKIPIKYIKIENNILENSILKKDIIDLNQNKEKHISWDLNLSTTINDFKDKDDLNENKLFEKFKKVGNTFAETNEKRIDTLERRLEKIEEMLKTIINTNKSTI
jgi:hypothetical protein